MGRRKKDKTILPGVTITWVKEGGVVGETKHIVIADAYRTMRSYALCIKHLERQAWEIGEGIKVDAWKEGHRRK